MVLLMPKQFFFTQTKTILALSFFKKNNNNCLGVRGCIKSARNCVMVGRAFVENVGTVTALST